MGWTNVPENCAVNEGHNDARREDGEPTPQVRRESKHERTTIEKQTMQAQLLKYDRLCEIGRKTRRRRM